VEDDVRDDALDVLRVTLVWRWTEGRWRMVAQAADALAAALAAGDDAACRAAVHDLALAGPVRAVSAENPPTEPAPDPVRERVNELIHTLGRQDTDGNAAGASG
jgi:hypothetical protein